MKKICAIILAAGRGTRMRSDKPKALQLLCGEPLVIHVIKNLKKVSDIKRIVVVLGYKGRQVEKCIGKEYPDIEFVYQREISGTASAVKAALPKVKEDKVLITCTDVPLLRSKTLKNFIRKVYSKKVLASVITADCSSPNDLGVVMRDLKGMVSAIKEKRELRLSDIRTNEINSGVYFFDRKHLSDNIKKIHNDNKKKEYYLTDIIAIFNKAKIGILPYKLKDYEEVMGINDRCELQKAQKVARLRVFDALFSKGVTVVDSSNTYISDTAKIGKGTVIYPFTFIEKNVIIGDNCSLGPFLRVRSGTCIKNNVQLGNFLEVNRCSIDSDVKAKHFGYIGDTRISKNVNIGAGVVVANYDGYLKHKTNISENAFVGSNSTLVAPAVVGKNAVIGAGSVVTKPVNKGKVVAGVPAKEIISKRKKRKV
ncbi:MAG: NTP transferase domain-containing protein [Candidatus Omnitrophica bacterium]|nr:NTP transferase domain-containing protein [Candidatus Omnitrophota bacterium]MDD5080425.1 NTP transferase domain-containing protein [Candidatus Omnitrophota bacterium]MDD5441035.1 NTP transferase domain-containing protein [Candidatus Omnitrophota bacterium]